MAVKKWKGDEAHLLPAQQVEPYRLWFEFLQLASKDETLTIATAFIAILVVARHADNIRRLIAGTEPKIGGSKT